MLLELWGYLCGDGNSTPMFILGFWGVGRDASLAYLASICQIYVLSLLLNCLFVAQKSFCFFNLFDVLVYTPVSSSVILILALLLRDTKLKLG